MDSALSNFEQSVLLVTSTFDEPVTLVCVCNGMKPGSRNPLFVEAALLALRDRGLITSTTQFRYAVSAAGSTWLKNFIVAAMNEKQA